jgi:hypothetical protein
MGSERLTRCLVRQELPRVHLPYVQPVLLLFDTFRKKPKAYRHVTGCDCVSTATVYT